MKNFVICARWLKWFSVLFVVPFLFFELIYNWCMDKVKFLAYLNNLDAQNWVKDLSALPFSHRILGFSVDAVSYVILLWGLFFFLKLLRHYQNGEFFSLRTFELMRKISCVAFSWTIYTPIKKMILSMVISWHNGPGNRLLTVTLDSHDVYHFFIVGLLMMIVSITYEGFKLKNEQDLTV